MKELKAQIKANFESNTFDVAMELNKDLLAEYENIKGKRGVSALVSYYNKQSQKNVTPSEVEEVEEVPAEPVESPTEQVEEVEASTEEVETPTEEPQTETSSFRVYKTITKEEIEKLLQSESPELDQYCVIKEYFEVKKDFEIVRTLDLFITIDENSNRFRGFSSRSEARTFQENAGMKSYRIKGMFDDSEEGFPVGEAYCCIRIMRLKEAFTKYGHRQNGIKEIKSIIIA